MRFTKRIISFALLITFVLSLTSCKKEVRNQAIPYGNISLSKVVLEAGDYNLTEKELYNRLRYTNGYSVFERKINQFVYADELTNVKYEGEDKITIDEKVASAVYGTDDVQELITKVKLDESKEDSEKELVISRKKFVDTMSQQGIEVTEEQLVFDTLNNNSEHVSFSNLPESLINYYKLDLAREDANIAYLNSIVDKEELPDNDDENVLTKNSYYFDETAFENQYNSYYKTYNDAYGIIIPFATLKDARDSLQKAILDSGNSALTKENALDVYVQLFNNYYNYKDEKLTPSTLNQNELTTFITDKDNNDLANFSDNVKNLFLKTLTDENNYLLSPVNLDGKYYLVYRESVEYLTGGSEETPFEEIINSANVETIKAECKTDYIESNASAVQATVYQDRLESLELKIYDPYLENTFANSNDFYEYVTDSNNDYIFTSNNDSLKYSVAEYFVDLQNYNVNSVATDLLIAKYLYHTQYSYLEEDAEKTFKDSLNDEIKAFKKGDKTLNKAYGEENYLFFAYGYTSYDEVVLNNMATKIKSAYLSDLLYESLTTDDHQINEESLGFLNNILETALNQLKDKLLFDINVDHILISIDNNADGEADDMDAFLVSLSDAEKTKFTTAVKELNDAIISEVEAITGRTTMEKLTYVVEAFNNGYPTHNGNNWDDYKTYNFILRAESLGDIDESSVSNYVVPFKEYIEEMFKKAVAEKLEIPEDKEKQGRLYFAKEGVTTENYTVEDLCQTVYGYHMLSLNSYEDTTDELNFKFAETSDPNGDYKDLKIILDENDVDDENDDIYFITDVYNDESADKPNNKQLVTYYVEYIKGDVTSFTTSIKNDLATLLNTAIDKYKATSFQTYVLVKSFADTIKVNEDFANYYDYDNYLLYLQNQAENYDLDSDYISWYTTYTWNR